MWRHNKLRTKAARWHGLGMTLLVKVKQFYCIWMTVEHTRVRKIVRSNLGMVSGCCRGHPYGNGHPTVARESQCWGNGMGPVCTQVDHSRPVMGELSGKDRSTAEPWWTKNPVQETWRRQEHGKAKRGCSPGRRSTGHSHKRSKKMSLPLHLDWV